MALSLLGRCVLRKTNVEWDCYMLWLAGLMGLVAVSAAVYVDVGEGDDNDEVISPSDDLVEGQGNIISGSDDDDVLTGSDNGDQIGGYDGDDIIDAGDGDDDAHGADGDDTLRGGAGNDSVHGDDGNDDINGGIGDDSLMGHNDDDVLRGGEGNDSLQGSDGDDQLFGDEGDDALQGGLGNDTLDGGVGEDTLFGGWGSDTINGIVDDDHIAGIQDIDTRDYLNGGGGDDVILTGQDDIVTSGEGADQIVLGDWFTQGHAAQIMDFTPNDDSLVFIWDDSAPDAEPPEVSIVTDPENPGDLQIMMGDMVVAHVTGDTPLDIADISLIPLSSAYSTGLLAA